MKTILALALILGLAIPIQGSTKDVQFKGTDYSCEDLSKNICQYFSTDAPPADYRRKCIWLNNVKPKRCDLREDYEGNMPTYVLTDEARDCKSFTGDYISHCEDPSITHGECKITKVKMFGKKVPKKFRRRGYQQDNRVCEAKQPDRTPPVFRLGNEYNSVEETFESPSNHAADLGACGDVDACDTAIDDLTNAGAGGSAAENFEGTAPRNCEVYNGNKGLCKYAGYERCATKSNSRVFANWEKEGYDNLGNLAKVLSIAGLLKSLGGPLSGDPAVSYDKCFFGDGLHECVFNRDVIGAADVGAVENAQNDCKPTLENKKFSYNVRKQAYIHTLNRKKDDTKFMQASSKTFNTLNLLNYEFCRYEGKSCVAATPEPIWFNDEFEGLETAHADPNADAAAKQAELDKMDAMCNQYTLGWLDYCSGRSRGKCEIQARDSYEEVMTVNGMNVRKVTEFYCARAQSYEVDGCSAHNDQKAACAARSGCIHVKGKNLRRYNNMRIEQGEIPIATKGYCHTISSTDFLFGDTNDCYKHTFSRKACMRDRECMVADDNIRCQPIS